MKKIFTCWLTIFCAVFYAQAQSAAINSDGSVAHPSAMLEIKSSNKGLLIPRVALTGATDATTIPSPAFTLMVYNTTFAGTGNTAIIPGYYYWNGGSWTSFAFNPTAAVTGLNDFVVKGYDIGQGVGVKKGYGAVGINYIIALGGTFPCHNGCGGQYDGALIGEIKLFTGNYPPEGWAICDGQLLPILGNQSLFAIIGTTYGGNGQTNFGVPDLRSAIPIQPGTSTTGRNWTLGEKQD